MASLPTPSADSRTRADALREALATRVVVADGAMGTMLQAQDPTLEDFQKLEGCNEILNVTRPDIVRSVHHAYFAVGVDWVETNTFGANLAALGEYDIAERVFELSSPVRASPGRSADEFSRRDRQPRWVLGLGRARARSCRRSATPRTPSSGTPTSSRPRACSHGGVDAVLVETTQDLLQTKAAVIGAKPGDGGHRRADLPVICTSPWRPPARCCSAPRSAPR